jgi:hypothetical protein
MALVFRNFVLGAKPVFYVVPIDATARLPVLVSQASDSVMAAVGTGWAIDNSRIE